jgi:hypothetical protein
MGVGMNQPFEPVPSDHWMMPHSRVHNELSGRNDPVVAPRVLT